MAKATLPIKIIRPISAISHPTKGINTKHIIEPPMIWATSEMIPCGTFPQITRLNQGQKNAKPTRRHIKGSYIYIDICFSFSLTHYIQKITHLMIIHHTPCPLAAKLPSLRVLKQVILLQYSKIVGGQA